VSAFSTRLSASLAARRRAAGGAGVTIVWHYDEEDDTMQELGEEFGEDLEHAAFRLTKLAAGS